MVPPRLDLPELAWPTPRWFQWVRVTGNLPSVPKPSPTLFLAVQQIRPRLHQAPGSPNGEGASLGAAQTPAALLGWLLGLARPHHVLGSTLGVH